MSNGLLVPNDLDKNKNNHVDLEPGENRVIYLWCCVRHFLFQFSSSFFILQLLFGFIMTSPIIMTFPAHKLEKD